MIQHRGASLLFNNAAAIQPVGFLLALLLVTGCGDQPGSTDEHRDPVLLETAADSLAYRVVEAMGAPAWESAPFVRFDFAIETDGVRALRRRHLWSKMDGRYRMERPIGDDSTLVVLFNTETQDGQAFVNGEELNEARVSREVASAYRAFINDVYWLSMPMKLFDEGVVRGIDADSSDGSMPVLTLAFDGVGLTPGDRYWVSVRPDGMVEQWSYLLQNASSPRTYRWAEYDTFDTAAGTVKLAPRKQADGRAILTDHIAFPSTVDDGYFVDAGRMLESLDTSGARH